MLSAVIDKIIVWTETKVSKEKTKRSVSVLKIFTHLDYHLNTYSNKTQTQLTIV